MLSAGEPFIVFLARHVEAYDSCGEDVESSNDAKRLEARQNQRQIEERFGAMFAFNRVEVARILVDLAARVEALEGRIGSDGDGALFWLGARVEALEGRG